MNKTEQEQHHAQDQVRQLNNKVTELENKLKQVEHSCTEYKQKCEQLNAQHRAWKEESDAMIESLRHDKTSASSLVQQKTLENNQLLGMYIIISLVNLYFGMIH